MNLRYLVPALGVIAVSSFAAADDAAAKPAAPAAAPAEAAPTFTFSGFIDTVGAFSSANAPGNANTAPGSLIHTTHYDSRLPELGFTNQDALKSTIKVNDSISGHISLYLFPNSGTSESTVNVREAYALWAINDDWTWQGGKYINSIGWLNPDPTGLYTVNNSLIGYQNLYGNDVIGTNVAWTDPHWAPFLAQVHVTNGYFNPGDASSIAQKSAFGGASAKNTEGRGNDDLGYGLALKWTFPNTSFIQFDAAYDPHGVNFSNWQLDGTNHGLAPAVAMTEGGNALLVGLQGQWQIRSDLFVAAEGQYFTVGDGYGTDVVGAGGIGAKIENSGGKREQGLLLANWLAPEDITKHGFGWISSFTGMVQAINAKSQTVFGSNAGAEKATQETLAVLTNPTSSSHFGLNGELSFTQFNDGVAGSEHVDSVSVSLEALLKF